MGWVGHTRILAEGKNAFANGGHGGRLPGFARLDSRERLSPHVHLQSGGVRAGRAVGVPVRGPRAAPDRSRRLSGESARDPVTTTQTQTTHPLDPLSVDILERKIREGQTVRVDARNGALEFREN